jgi:hypothetical protein
VRAERGPLDRRRFALALGGGVLVLALALAAGAGLGAAGAGFGALAPDAPEAARAILWDVRLPRVLSAAALGAALALAGPHVDRRVSEFGVPQQRRQVVDRQDHADVIHRAVRRRTDRPIGQLASGEQPDVTAASDRRRLVEADPGRVHRAYCRCVRWWKLAGLAGLVGAAAVGIVAIKRQRARVWTEYPADELRDRLRARLREAPG